MKDYSPKNKEIYEAFVSMPYGADEDDSRRYWNDFYNAITDMHLLFKTRNYSINFSRAAETISHLLLKESVIKQINSSHLVIAVITGLNPNVFWEIGYAQCLNKPVIFLVVEDSKEAQNSPVLISETLRLQYHGEIFDISPQDESLVSDFQKRILPYLNTAIDIIKGQPEEMPRYKVFSDRSSVNLAEKVFDAQKSIDVITSNLSYFADIDKFFVDTEGDKKFPFDEPIKKGVKIRILSLNPDSSIAEYRAKQLGLEFDVARYREELRHSAHFFYQRYKDNENVEIWIYEDLPLQITFIIDDEVFTSIMSSGNRSRKNIHLSFDIEFEGVRRSFEQHFSEVLANKAQTSHISHFAWAQASL